MIARRYIYLAGNDVNTDKGVADHNAYGKKAAAGDEGSGCKSGDGNCNNYCCGKSLVGTAS